MPAWLESLIYFFLAGFAKAAAGLPERFVYRMGDVFGRVIYYFSGRRRVAYADLKAAFGTRFSEKERRRIVKAHYRHLGQSFMEVLRFPVLDRKAVDRNIRIHHVERFQAIVAENRGAVLLTAHLGNFELLQIVSGILGKPIYALGRDQKFRRLYEFLIALRRSHGSVAVSRGIGVRDLLRALRRRELVGVLGDQSAGRRHGLIMNFFGRKTTFPTGAFEMAVKTGAPVLPSFITRTGLGTHEIFVEEPIRVADPGIDSPEFQKAVARYVKTLEALISRFPEQWFWAKKRWKYSWTKRLLILSDGKPGHVRQSEAVAAYFRGIPEQYGRAGMEYPVTTIGVRFRSSWKRVLFYFFGFLFFPWAQSRLGCLKFFFDKETQERIESASADFVISAGAGLIPLNLCLAKDSQAKSIVLMKPPFPYNLLRYPLAVVPWHDAGKIPADALRTLLTPSSPDDGEPDAGAEAFCRALKNPAAVCFAVFLGGATRRYRMEIPAVKDLIEKLEALGATYGDYLITTSRRTSRDISNHLKKRIASSRFCQKLVIAAEDPSPATVPGMMAAAEILIVTEDSISMISEAVASGKKVLVLCFGEEGASAKHRRFQEILEKEKAVIRSGLDDLEEKIHLIRQAPASDLAGKEQGLLKKRLQEIL